MDAILAATASVRRIFDEVASGQKPAPADQALIARLRAAANKEARAAVPAPAPAPAPRVLPRQNADGQGRHRLGSLLQTDHRSAASAPAQERTQPSGRRASDDPAVEEASTGRRAADKVAVTRDTTIRVDTARLDQVLTLSGELGLAKNRVMCLRHALSAACKDGDLARNLEEATRQLDLAVGDLQRAVMKTRMQPVGRLFQKYPRIARDLSRQLGKDVELVIEGEETELDRSIIDDLSEPLVHLVRNAVDHGVETKAERAATGKAAQAQVKLAARQEGDHVVIEIRDDGRGMDPDVLRRKAVEKGLMDAESAQRLDSSQAFSSSSCQASPRRNR